MPPNKKRPHRWILDNDGLIADKPVDGWCPEQRAGDARPHHCIACKDCGWLHCIYCGDPIDSLLPCKGA